ncbi:MAG: T9SS type A sorting domain-containing protein [Saprospiraceae bacterium]|jgi:hypothetical protein|nr:T9SS type A sorting domain-containing protein [Saprospiraceae bacterium]
MRIPNLLSLLLLLALAFPLAAQNAPCEIYDLVVEAGPCTSDTTYTLKLNFKVQNPPSSEFTLVGNGKSLGAYHLSDLPLTISNFPAVGLGGYVKVCMAGNSPASPPCCAIKQFVAPDCSQSAPCEIYDVKVETGDCLPNGQYKIKLDFKVAGATNSLFEAWAGNGQYLGHFPLNQLPVSLNFPASGGAVDKIKICINDNPNCCRVHEFKAPTCPPTPCQINDLRVETGECTSDSTYKLVLNFKSPGVALTDSFNVYAADGAFLGRFAYAALPISIANYPWGGLNVDAVKICISNTCCRTLEFNVPACFYKDCGIGDIKVDVGDCIDAKTYKITLNFNLTLPTPGAGVLFEVRAGNGDSLGTFGPGALPLQLVFPRSGDATDRIKVCLINPNGVKYCCKIIEFKPPVCNTNPCPISDLKVDVGPCNSDGTYSIVINFKNSSPTPGAFGVWAGNGKFLGIFPLSALPLKIAKFPASGNAKDVVKVCLLGLNSTAPTCCLTAEFEAPDCSQNPCGIFDLNVEVGPCNNDGTFLISLKFGTLSAQGQFGVWAGNGQFLGLFPFSALPLKISNFPAGGNAVDVVKVCVFLASGPSTTCCLTKEFKAPDCGQLDCEIYDLKVETGPCNNDGTYKAIVNFKVHNPGLGSHFMLWANGNQLGVYPLTSLPLVIPNFPTDGGPNDYIKVCLINPASNIPSDCCKALEFHVPDCADKPCEIYDLKVEVSPCNSDGTFKVFVNFKVENPTSDHFMLWANGALQGTYKLSDLPLTIAPFPTNGGPNDYIKVCMVNAAGVPGDCCRSIEFAVPDCNSAPCEIYDLKVETGPCNADGTFKAIVNFKVQNPGAGTHFMLWANGALFGTFPLSALPLTIANFPTNGGPNDVVKVCILSAAGAVGNCCRTLEFPVPNCTTGPCEIYDLKVETGPCNSDGTFKAIVNFKVQNPGAGTHFMLWANGALYGTFPLSALPLTIPNFPTNGGPNDVVKVCMVNANGASGDCCRTLEFPVPNCMTGPCEIYDLKVETGPCNADGTFKAIVNFKVQNPGAGTHFMLWANGALFGTFPLSALPLTIANFPTNGGPNDYIKVCLLVPGSSQSLCCREKEFAVPDCLNKPCEIYDLNVQATPCLCGQFFALVTFEHKNGSGDGFDIVGNGKDYGTFPYNQQQPIILGPLDGDDLTEYEFVVRDHNHPDCHDVFELGKVDCNDQFATIKTADKLTISPNPTSTWLTVMAQPGTGKPAGQVLAEIRKADGRLMRSVEVANGSNFQMDVSELPAGIYRLTVQSADARMESTFVKQ